MEEKAKNRAKQPKKEKDNNNYNYNKKTWTGVWERSFPPLHLLIFFFAFSLLGPEPEPTQIKL